jgi:small subunit ribosomal protein S26e
MPSKRRNNGRGKGSSRGVSGNVHCDNCARLVPKDKAIKKFTVRDIIDAASKDDIGKASAYKERTQVPKLMLKMYYCVSCAIHARIVAVRSAVDRRKRDTGKKKFQARQQPKPEQKKEENKPATTA